MDEKLLTLPWQIQVALGSGYCAYMLAYSGIRAGHTATDTAFRAIAFGLIATGFLYLLPVGRPVVSICLAFLATVLVGAGWRALGRDAIRWILKKSRVSQADDTDSAWARMMEDSKHDVLQVTALLDDGTFLTCDDTTKFRDAPLGPCVFGGNGDLMLYVTSSESPSGEVTKVVGTRDSDWGDLITFVPASRIRQLNIRHRRK